MMPICQHKCCRKTATIKVGEVYNYKDSKIKDVYDPIYMCSKHALKFIKKYGGEKMSNLLGVECIKCHKRSKFPSADMAEVFGWSQVNYDWYCPNCDFEEEE